MVALPQGMQELPSNAVAEITQPEKNPSRPSTYPARRLQSEIRYACAMANVYSGDGEKLPPIPKPPAPEISKRQRKLGI